MDISHQTVPFFSIYNQFSKSETQWPQLIQNIFLLTLYKSNKALCDEIFSCLQEDL